MSGSNPKAAAAGSAAGPGALVAGKEEKKKAGGGVLNRLKARRQAPPHATEDGIGAAVTEQELLALDTIRPEHVLRLSRVTESECPLGRALPSRWAPGPGPLVAFSGAGRSPPDRPGGPPCGPLGRPGRAAGHSAGRALRLPPSTCLGWEGVLFELDRVPLRPATPGFSWAGRSWASRPAVLLLSWICVGREPPLKLNWILLTLVSGTAAPSSWKTHGDQ